MSQFDPNKLFVELRDGINSTVPVIQRRHTLTHSDETGDLFLTTGLTFAYDKINEMRDEVLGEWVNVNGFYYYYVYLYIGGPFDLNVATIRNDIFRSELPLALTAIRFGDEKFFQNNPKLNDIPIIVHFMSTYPQFHTVEDWGSFSDYQTI